MAGRSSAQTATAWVAYHFPMSGAQYVPPASDIIIRPNEALDMGTMRSAFEVTGSATGVHTGRFLLSDDDKTIVFIPSEPFQPLERVSVVLNSGVVALNGDPLRPMSFSFTVSPAVAQQESSIEPFVAPFQGDPMRLNLPADFPAIQVTIDNDPAPGSLFLTTFNFYGGTEGNYRMIIDSLAEPVYYAKPSNFLDWDFKTLPNGQLGFCEGEYDGKTSTIVPGCKYYAMDSGFTIVDSFDAYNSAAPYTTDFHDMELLPHNHALLLGLAQLPNWDMSKDVPGGNAHALLLGAVIEEIDSLKKPVWIWRSWDSGHFSDTDATNDPGDLLEDTIDAVHANAVQVDTDGNILLSCRSMDEIAKIDRSDSTGSLIWRFGGKHNQFQFVNDSIHFSHQHALRRIANGDLTLFDNGNYGHNVKRIQIYIDSSEVPSDTIVDTLIANYSRACEYRLDLRQMTATLVWHYDHDSTIRSSAMGYVQRLPNGNTLINWGFNFSPGTGLSDQPAVTEVRPDGTIAYELHINVPLLVYRAYKLPWNRPMSGVLATSQPEDVLKLGEPFPNPSSGAPQVVFSAPIGAPVSLKLYDPAGRVVRDYFEGRMPVMVSAMSISTSGLSNGIYELWLEANGQSASRPLVVLH